MKPGALFQFIKQLVTVLRQMEADFALVGGMALGFRALERTTKDIDLAFAVKSDQEAEALVRALQERGFALFSVLEHEKTGRLATARLYFPVSSKEMVVDLLFASCGIESEVVKEAEWINVLPGVRMKVAKRPHLLAMKVLSMNTTDRRRDMDDALALLRHSSKREVAKAKRLLGLITKRGYNRNRRLLQRLKALCIRGKTLKQDRPQGEGSSGILGRLPQRCRCLI